MPLAYTGKLPALSSAESRIAPQITMPATPRCSARADISSPIRAWSLNPPPSTTITSPGSAVSIALWMSRLSPGAVRTVNAGPQSFAPLCMGRSWGPAAYRRCMLSERCGVTIRPSSATSFLSGRFGMGRMRKPIPVMSVAPLDELHRDPAQGPEVPVQGIALVREHDARKRPGEDEVTRVERDSVLPELVREPRHAERRMAEHTGGKARLLDLGVAVHDSAGPARVHFHRPDRTPADDDARRRAVVGDGVEDLARVYDARVDDLHRRDHVLGRAQHVREPDSGALEGLSENEGELDLDARDAVVRVRHFRAAADAHGDDDVLRAAPLAFDERVAGEACARHAVGVAEGDRAAVDVQPLVRDAEPVAAVDDLHREGFVQFPQTNVFHFQPGARKQSRHGEHRADAHFVGLAAGYREAAENPERSQVALFGELRVHDDAGGGGVGELARVSGRDRAAFDRRLDLGHALESRVRADAFVVLRRDFLDPAFPRLLVGLLHSHRQGEDFRVEAAR